VIKTILGTIAGLLLGAAIMWTLLNHKTGTGQEAELEEQPETSHVLHTNGRTFLKLDRSSRTNVGLKLAPLEAATLKPEVKGFGRVLDPAPLAALGTESAMARTALDASTKELQRLKVLAQDQNASARALEAAAAVAQRDQIAVDAAHLRLVTSWGPAVASQADLPAFVRALVAHEAALIRIDVPLGEVLKQPPSGGRIAALTEEDQAFEAEFLGPAPNADALTQGEGFLFVLRKQRLPPEAAVIGWLTVPGESRNGVIIPRSAIVRHEGEAFAYVEAGDGLFERTQIELKRPTENGWFAQNGLKPGQKVVVVGAQQLLSEELKGQGGEE
jgi:hypothetical protein